MPPRRRLFIDQIAIAGCLRPSPLSATHIHASARRLKCRIFFNFPLPSLLAWAQSPSSAAVSPAASVAAWEFDLFASHGQHTDREMRIFFPSRRPASLALSFAVTPPPLFSQSRCLAFPEVARPAQPHCLGQSRRRHWRVTPCQRA